jgi:hypothetical protein
MKRGFSFVEWRGFVLFCFVVNFAYNSAFLSLIYMFMLRLLNAFPCHLGEAYFQSEVILLFLVYFVVYCGFCVMDGTFILLGYNTASISNQIPLEVSVLPSSSSVKTSRK